MEDLRDAQVALSYLTRSLMMFMTIPALLCKFTILHLQFNYPHFREIGRDGRVVPYTLTASNLR